MSLPTGGAGSWRRSGCLPETPLVAFSAKTGAGKESLWREIRKAVES